VANLRKSDSPADLLNKAHPRSGEAPFAFGVPPLEVSDQEQYDHVKELQNKLSWAIGSTYRQAYSSRASPVADYVRRVTGAILRDHGYYKTK